MHTLLMSISFSVAVSVFLKLARKYDIHVGQAIAINYVTASLMCLFVLQPAPGQLFVQTPVAWFILAVLGVLLPSVFIIMAAAVRLAGIVLSDTAQRLSLIIPIIAAFLVFNETLSAHKAAGVALALCALACLLQRPEARNPGTGNGKAWWVLLGVWAGYGFIDIAFKQMARIGAGFGSSLLLSFILAGLLMFTWLVLNKTAWSIRSLASGILLGAMNFGNIYFYIRAHQSYPDNPTLVFAAMNMGVISLGTLVGAGIFRERLGVFNMLGIGMALGAIYLLLP